MDQALTLRIRERAYYIWTETGGDPQQNWLRAELEILTGSDLQPPPALAPKKQRAKSRRKKRFHHDTAKPAPGAKQESG